MENDRMIDTKLTGERIKTVCKIKGITVRQIQEELHIGAYQSVYGWFHGQALPSLDNFYELSKLLHVPMESLIVEERKNRRDKRLGGEHSRMDRIYQYYVKSKKIFNKIA